MLETLRNAFKIEDIRKRIGYTFPDAHNNPNRFSVTDSMCKQ